MHLSTWLVKQRVFQKAFSSMTKIKLNKNCILGIDMLKKSKARINVDENYIMLRNEGEELKIKFIDDEENLFGLSMK